MRGRRRRRRRRWRRRRRRGNSVGQHNIVQDPAGGFGGVFSILCPEVRTDGVTRI